MKKGKIIAIILIVLSSCVLAWNVLMPILLYGGVSLLSQVAPQIQEISASSEAELLLPQSSSIGIIGGADGPTAVLYAASISDTISSVLITILSLAILILSIVYLVRSLRKSN